MKIETLSVHVGRDVTPDSGAVAPPIQMSSTFQRDADGSYSRGYSYAREGDPGRSALERCLAALEGGAEAFAFSSGSAASLAVFSLLRPGDHVIAPIECYHGTAKQLRELIGPYGVSCSFVDLTRADLLQAVLSDETRLVWIETPSNPMLKLSDIERISQLAHARGALVCVDNTFATPLWQRPFELGADLVMHSSTKYFGGHSDVLGGALISKQRDAVAERLRNYQRTAGSVPSGFDAWLIRRSLTTFPWRVRAQSENAQRIAEFLHRHPAVERTLYPGLPDHPAHALAQRQMRGGYGAVVSICVRGGRAEAFQVAERTQLFTRATSLGGVESLVEHRASVEGPRSTTPENLLRLSVGLEHADDLIDDLDRALRS